MNDFIRYEIKAEAFRLETGFMAPGKDTAAGTNEDEDTREKIYKTWIDWCVVNNAAFNRFIQAAETVGVE